MDIALRKIAQRSREKFHNIASIVFGSQGHQLPPLDDMIESLGEPAFDADIEAMVEHAETTMRQHTAARRPSENW